MNNPRLLRKDEISCRVQQVTDYGDAIILLYKDARTDMNLLDETFGAMNWQREHTTIDGNLYCTIKVWDGDKKEWVAKQDVGTESNTEATKGEASDAFKRAGFNWGIGRELYTGPFIKVRLEADEMKKNPNNGKNQATFKFGLTVDEITYTDNKEIRTLVLVDKEGRQRFSYGTGKAQQKSPVTPMSKVAPSTEDKPAPTRNERITSLCKYHDITVLEFNSVARALAAGGDISSKQLNDMDDNEFAQVISKAHAMLVATKKEVKA